MHPSLRTVKPVRPSLCADLICLELLSVLLFLHNLDGVRSKMPQLTSSPSSGYRPRVRCSLPVQEDLA